MSNANFLEKLLNGAEVEWKPLGEVFDIFAGGDVPQNAFSNVETEEFNVPILSNGIEEKSLYGWTDKAKIDKPSLTISARGTIGWTSFRNKPFFPDSTIVSSYAKNPTTFEVCLLLYENYREQLQSSTVGYTSAY